MSRIGQTKIEKLMGACFDRAGECEGCVFAEFCDQNEFGSKPKDWFCADPPRFTEAQMALLKALWDIGARFLACDFVSTGAYSCRPRYDAEICEWQIDADENAWTFENGVFGLRETEIIDLAELFGKEGNYVSVP